MRTTRRVSSQLADIGISEMDLVDTPSKRGRKSPSTTRRGRSPSPGPKKRGASKSPAPRGRPRSKSPAPKKKVATPKRKATPKKSKSPARRSRDSSVPSHSPNTSHANDNLQDHDLPKGFISPAGLRELANYSYHGTENSFSAQLILEDFWTWIVEFVPLSIAPNMLTFVGLLCNIIAYNLIAHYDPNLDQEAPAWTYVAVAVLIFTYQTLDNIDGKQARRTKCSSPLGELFDHVVDSMTVPMFALTTGSALGLGPHWTFLLLWGIALPFYFAHWEEYYVGELVLAKWTGPTEAQNVMMGLEVATAYFGQQTWKYPVNLPYFGVTPLNVIGVTGMALLALHTVITQHFTAVRANAHKRNSTFGAALCQLTPFTVFFVSSVAWAFGAPGLALLGAHPRTFVLTVGITFSFLVSRLIVQRICSEPMRVYYSIVFVPVLNALNYYAAPLVDATKSTIVDDVHLLNLSFWVVMAFQAHLCLSLINQLTNHLNIYCFSVQKPAARVPVE
eukprot:TRINITY_DN5286_c0_g1_i1.p1 TRINITY_DN5286_c0_g1~~TRINITY_DN5286_c0_g1_i1.p1  ORF type:complete len:515 (+),score=123.52 TRINITY_DN5286_c0_g1_i1:35-1546(+)